MSSLLQTLFDLWHHGAAASGANQIDPPTASTTGVAATAPAVTAAAAPAGPAASAPSAPSAPAAPAGGSGAGTGTDAGAGAPHPGAGASIPAYSPLGLQDGPVPTPPPWPDLMNPPPGGLHLDGGASNHWSGWDLNVPPTGGDSSPDPSFTPPDYDPQAHDPGGIRAGLLQGPDEGGSLQWNLPPKSPLPSGFGGTPPGGAEGSGDLQVDPSKPLLPTPDQPTPPPSLNPPGPHPPMTHTQSMTETQSMTHQQSLAETQGVAQTQSALHPPSWAPSFTTNTVLNADGTTSIHYPDGTQDVRAPDGSCWRLAPGGAVVNAWQEPPVPQWQPPQSIAAGQPDGGTVIFHPDGSKELWHGNAPIARFAPDGSPMG